MKKRPNLRILARRKRGNFFFIQQIRTLILMSDIVYWPLNIVFRLTLSTRVVSKHFCPLNLTLISNKKNFFGVCFFSLLLAVYPWLWLLFRFTNTKMTLFNLTVRRCKMSGSHSTQNSCVPMSKIHTQKPEVSERKINTKIKQQRIKKKKEVVANEDGNQVKRSICCLCPNLSTENRLYTFH